MPARQHLLFVVFARSDVALDLQGQRTDRQWTAPKNARPGDVALFYRAGVGRNIYAVGRVDEPAWAGRPGDWTTSDRAFFAQYEGVVRLSEPLGLDEIRTEFPTWKRWNNLRGVRVHIVPDESRERLAKMVVRRNPSARVLLSAWLPTAMQAPKGDSLMPIRSMVTARRRLRDADFSRRVRSQQRDGECGACLSQTNYEELGILQAAHIRSVEHDGPDDLSNALALCPNHHALFDEGLWTIDGKRIVLRGDLPIELAETFRDVIRCEWDLDPAHLEWHRTKVFRQVKDAG